MGDLLRLWVFIGGCCDVISRVGCTQDLQCGIPRCCIVSDDFLTMCVCVCVCGGGGGEGGGGDGGLLRRKGGKMGERRELQKTQYDQRLGDFCRPHYTRQLSGQKYIYS